MFPIPSQSISFEMIVNFSAFNKKIKFALTNTSNSEKIIHKHRLKLLNYLTKELQMHPFVQGENFVLILNNKQVIDQY